MTPAQWSFIRVLFQMIWTDGSASPDHVESIIGILRRMGVPHPQIICLMDQNLVEKPADPPMTLDQIFVDRTSLLEALKSVMAICLSDGLIQPEVLGYLEGTIIRMGITSSELETLRVAAMDKPC